MERFSTDGMPALRRAATWNSIYSRAMNPVRFVPEDRGDFCAELRLGQLGPLGIASVAAGRSSIERTRRHIGVGTPRLFSFILQASGSGTFNHCGHDVELHEGDFVLCDSEATHLFTLGESFRIVLLRVPAEMLREHLPCPEQYCGRRLAADCGFTRTLAATLTSLSDQIADGIVRGDHGARFARHLLDLMATTFAMGFDALPRTSAVKQNWQARIVRFVEDNLREPELSARTVAEGLGISQRYLRTVFAVSGERISAYINRRRLEECARQIGDPGWRGHTMTQIAFAWGFNSAAHFTRNFREQFDMSPREYRRRKLAS